MDETAITQAKTTRPAAASGAAGKPAPVAVPRTAPEDSLAQRARAEWRRVRRSVTLENLKNLSKTLAWVVPLTVLIWIYAEQEQISQDQNVLIHVQLVPTDPNQVLENVQPATGDFTVELQGPRAALDRVETGLREVDLRGSGEQIPINGGRVDPDGKPVKISATDTIASDDLLVRNGVNVMTCIPEYIQFNVDRIVSADADVVVPPKMNLEGSTFDPPKVQVRGPAKLIQTLRESDKLHVIADLGGLVGAKKPGGPYALTDVPLLKPVDDPDLTLLTTKASAQVMVKATDITSDKYTRPIWISLPSGFDPGYWVELGVNNTKVVGDVIFSGPVDAINSLKDPAVMDKIHAVVDIPGIEPPTGKADFRWVGLPPGVSVVDNGDNKSIAYKIVQR